MGFGSPKVIACGLEEETHMPDAAVTAGIDIGSLSTDAVLMAGGEVLSHAIVPTLANSEEAAGRAYEEALRKAGLTGDDVSNVVATGYGRSSIDFASKAITEITCHAVGARHLFPEVRSVIDIGGQDSKVIRLSDDGRVEDFAMNDKCAAGTGRFLEVMARSLGADVTALGELSGAARADIRISSTCTVFAESEVVALVAKGTPREDIVRGLHRAISERIYGMVVRLRAQPPFVMSGGVAKNAGVVSAIEEQLGTRVLVPDEPQIVGAIGAAILAQRAQP